MKSGFCSNCASVPILHKPAPFHAVVVLGDSERAALARPRSTRHRLQTIPAGRASRCMRSRPGHCQFGHCACGRNQAPARSNHWAGRARSRSVREQSDRRATVRPAHDSKRRGVPQFAGLTMAALSQVSLVRGLGSSWSQPLLANRPSQIVGSGQKVISSRIRSRCQRSGVRHLVGKRPSHIARFGSGVRHQTVVKSLLPSFFKILVAEPAFPILLGRFHARSTPGGPARTANIS